MKNWQGSTGVARVVSECIDRTILTYADPGAFILTYADPDCHHRLLPIVTMRFTRTGEYRTTDRPDTDTDPDR